ncbi:AraC family transcriptional regulator [Marinomonas sp. A79]|uniref:AraC family transcriptional regulator n=1 Tax=Marinomonas vulgaris TaxID=2823372 RepID=A0ABS5HD21_9GAMM|nr:AraC family transcriptional regulator [Marinomonas vulgaris]MBR7889538.1 AraC family transcriptional regulator [Marinomonas vulgaris]
MAEPLRVFTTLLTQYALEEGFTPSLVPGVGVFRASQPQSKTHAFYEPLICLMGQGSKRCYVGDRSFTYESGDFFINFLPMPVSTEVIGADHKTPLLSASLDINLVRLADMVLRIERLEGGASEVATEKSSSLMIGKASESLVGLFIKLLELSRDPLDAKILGDQVIDEIYYRMLTSEHGSALRMLLNQYGDIQPISKVVNYIHDNTNRAIHVQELADLANMSKTRFFNAFKQIMHVPPMQYIKSSKLQKAQALLKQGMSANEASYQVGYNSFSQFSREYKRFFGFSPSHTLKAA